MNKVAIIHYLPLEFYPPITNMIKVFAGDKELNVQVWSTHNNKKRPTFDSKIKISRSKFPNVSDNSVLKLLKYATFNLKCLFGLIVFKPTHLLYFESFSVWPVHIYLKYFNKKTKLFIHYHEYFSPVWYKNGMRLVKYYNKLEKSYLYNKATWISQTNQDRMKMFLEDNKIQNSNKMRILPNYPPKLWGAFSSKDLDTEIIKTVYIGTLSLDYSYIKEYCQWVISKNGKVCFDIYGYNYNEETLAYLSSINSPYINFYKSGIDYDDIPNILQKYSVGVILYKALTDNYKYNAPNKLFEYLTCNLQVWYADKMLGIVPYNSSEVVAVNFDKLDTFNYNTVFKKTTVGLKPNYTAEQALIPLINELNQ